MPYLLYTVVTVVSGPGRQYKSKVMETCLLDLIDGVVEGQWSRMLTFTSHAHLQAPT
jgi:hypothetical protein